MIFAVLALLGGAAIAVQATMNAQLGQLLNSSVLAAFVAFLVSALFSLLVFSLFAPHYPLISEIKSVPYYLWFTGGALSAFGVGMFYFLIPKMGAGPLISFALTGQLALAIIISHFGWFGSPIKPITLQTLAGAVALVGGVVLLNWERANG